MNPFVILSSTRVPAPVCIGAPLAVPMTTTRSFVSRLRRTKLSGGRTSIAMTGAEAERVALWRSKGLSKADACAIVFGGRS